MKQQAPGKPGIKVREQAARCLVSVIYQHQSLDDAISSFDTGLPDNDRSLMQAISYGVMRWLPQLQAWMARLVDRPVDQVSQPVSVLIYIGLYQLMYSRVPPHAAIHATVDCAPRLKSARAKGMINAVLRNFQRRYEKEREEVEQDRGARYAHPEWMLSMFETDWPGDWEAIAQANNRQAPMTLRVAAGHAGLNQYIGLLQQQDISATQHAHADSALILDKPANVQDLPGFNEGMVSVQDAAAQLAVPLLKHNGSHRVLDACAAPGGKTAHIFQLQEPAELDALDVSATRLEKLNALFDRIGLQANVLKGDAATPQDWWDGRPYDRILLDAPCSASGVIRRHPDIKHHRTPEALEKIIARQAAILDALWPLLVPGGILLYVTCSIFKAENEQQVKAFCERSVDAVHDPLAVRWGRGEWGKQVLPGEADMDGFYFARLIKKPS